MECKFRQVDRAGAAKVELIDTLWNVNENLICAEMERVRELIDTLWNVNIDPGDSDFKKLGRINRYIMECKCSNGKRQNSKRYLN